MKLTILRGFVAVDQQTYTGVFTYSPTNFTCQLNGAHFTMGQNETVWEKLFHNDVGFFSDMAWVPLNPKGSEQTQFGAKKNLQNIWEFSGKLSPSNWEQELQRYEHVKKDYARRLACLETLFDR